MTNAQLAERYRRLAEVSDPAAKGEVASNVNEIIKRFLEMYPPKLRDIEKQLDALYDRQEGMLRAITALHSEYVGVKRLFQEYLQDSSDDEEEDDTFGL